MCVYMGFEGEFEANLPRLTLVAVTRQWVSRAPRVAVGVASAANNEAVSADWVARLVVEPGFEAAHGRIAVLFAT